MKTSFKIGTAWLALLIFILLGSVAHAEQTIVISDAGKTLAVISETMPAKKIENAYPGLPINFSAINLKNQSFTKIRVSLTVDNQIVDNLVLTNHSGKVILETFDVSPMSTYQVKLTGTIKESLGNERQEETIRLPLTLHFSEKTTEQTPVSLLPQTSDALFRSRLALLSGLVLIASASAYQLFNRE